MFIGHFGAALGAKKIDNRISLGTLFLAAQFMDLLWPIFIILGIEKVAIDPGNTALSPLNFYYYPFTHSMAASLFWGFLLGSAYFLVAKNKRGAFLVGALVFSHWILDLITHRADLQILPGVSYKVGLGLWNSIPAAVILETLIFIAGVYFFLQEYKPKSTGRLIGFWVLIAFLTTIYIMNIMGPPPPDEKSIGYAGLAQWLFIIWAYWIDYKGREIAAVTSG